MTREDDDERYARLSPPPRSRDATKSAKKRARVNVTISKRERQTRKYRA